MTTVPCPQCGGDATLPSGRRLLRCEFCGSSLFFDRAQVVSRYGLPRLLDKEGAEAALKRWMTGNETVKDLDRKSSIESMSAVSFPMWLFRVVDDQGEEAVVEPAAPTPIPQIADLVIPAGELEPWSDETDPAVAPMEPSVPLETARTWLEQRGAGAIVETAMVQVPLWRCTYSFGGATFTALVDGSTGEVMAAVYPEKRDSPFVLVAALGILLFGLEGLAITNPVAKLLAYVVTAVPLVFVAYWVAKKV